MPLCGGSSVPVVRINVEVSSSLSDLVPTTIVDS